jgi:hypothetical protein
MNYSTRKKFFTAALVLFPLSSTAEIRYTLTNTLEAFSGWAMNEAGSISGQGSNGLAQIFTPGVGLQSLPVPEGVENSYGYVINESGQVGGYLSYKSSYWGATYSSFIYTPGPGGGMQLTNTPIGIGSVLSEGGIPNRLGGPVPPWSIYAGFNTTSENAAGYAAGYSYFNAQNSYGMAWLRNPDSTFNIFGLDFPNSESQAYGINNVETVVGRVVTDIGNRMYAFGYLSGIGGFNLFDATDPASRIGWTGFVSAQDVTNDGNILGFGIYQDNYHSYLSSFVLTPISAIPEPSSFALCIFGLALTVTFRQLIMKI